MMRKNLCVILSQALILVLFVPIKSHVLAVKQSLGLELIEEQ